jgi:hypothetical protein
MWSSTLAHLATSGPSSHVDAMRMFDDEPTDPGRDPMVQFDALADLISFVTVGDMALAAIATLYLHRWDEPHRDDNPWPAFLGVLDGRDGPAADRLVGPSRRADALLRQARHRLVAHRRRYHAEIIGWKPSGAVFVDIVNPALHQDDQDGRDARDEVAKHLARAQLGVVDAHDSPYSGVPTWDDADLSTGEIARRFDWLHSHVIWMDADARRALEQAHRIAGYESVEPDAAVDAVLSMTRPIDGADGEGRSDMD